MNSMDFFTVIYTSDETEGDGVLLFQCWADDHEHAWEQCADAEADYNPKMVWNHRSFHEHTAEDAISVWKRFTRKQ